MTQRHRPSQKNTDLVRGSALLGRALGELARVRDEARQWKDKANALQTELHRVKQEALGRLAPSDEAAAWRQRAQATESAMGDVQDQNRMLRMAGNELETLLDDQDAQIESLIKHCAGLEAERAQWIFERAQLEAALQPRRPSVWRTELTTPLELLRQRLRRQRVSSPAA